jgi:cell fate regulator YaaT (PSP1 superfamily)
MCCLTYEHDSYVQARKKFPREGKTLVTLQGRERVISIDIWRERVLLRDEEGNRRTVELADLRAEVARAGEDGSAPERARGGNGRGQGNGKGRGA